MLTRLEEHTIVQLAQVSSREKIKTSDDVLTRLQKKGLVVVEENKIVLTKLGLKFLSEVLKKGNY